MSRDAQIPIVLWLTAAIVVHMAGGEGAATVSRVLQDRAQMRALVNSVRSNFSQSDKTIEVSMIDETPTPEDQKDKDDEAKADDKDEEDVKPDDDPNHEAIPVPPKPKIEKEKEKKPEDKKPEPPKVAEEKKPEPPKPVIAVPMPPAPPPPPPPPMEPDHRLAIRQHVDPNQPDNPNANRISDDANHVEEETMAKIRAHDQDAQSPQMGNRQLDKGPKDKEGNAADDKEADSEQHRGDEKRAPGENDSRSTSAQHNEPKPPSGAKVADKAGGPPGANDPARGAAGKASQAPLPGAPPAHEGGSGNPAPDVVAGNDGTYTVDPANPGGDGHGKRSGKKRSPQPYKSPIDVGAFGLGHGSPFNATNETVVKAVGEDQLRKERMADGQARLTRHRGSAPQNKFGEYKAAIENYDPSVKPGNQTALNAARSVFATYLNTIHNRIHPIFADEFLSSLDAASKQNVMNKPDLWTRIEIVLSKDQGKIVRFGVVKGSGVTAFDIIALNSVKRAEPFGKAPDAIVSPDGNVYLHWEFHRDPFDACTTRNARPFLLAKSAPTLTPTPGRPGKSADPGSSDAPRITPPPLLPLK